jgi:hypothetical protein
MILSFPQKIAGALLACMSAGFLCSCATPTRVSAPLPPEISFNQAAGRGDWVRIKPHLANGQELSLMVDTGGPHTVLDKSLEPLLGKRLGNGTWYEPFLGGFVKVGLYRTPKLYVGNVPLATSLVVYTYDFQKESPTLKGILGMDCLRNYCVQFDFAARKMRFLDPNQPDGQQWGEPFPLMILFGLTVVHADCFGTGRTYFCTDTGLDLADGMLLPGRYARKLRHQTPVWANTFVAYDGAVKKAAGLATGAFGGQTYSNLMFMEWAGSWPGGNLVGLPFLARHLVTFDFPKKMMYLKPVTALPLNPETFPAFEMGNYLSGLRDKGQLPGWSKNDSGGADASQSPITLTNFPITLTFNAQKAPATGWVDVLPQIKSILAAGTRQIPVTNHLAGYDPAPNTVKQLRLRFYAHGRQQTLAATEGQTLIVPVLAELTEARYGDLSAAPTNPNRTNDISIYHYTIGQASPNSPCKLQKAWRTDAKAHVIQEYSLP